MINIEGTYIGDASDENGWRGYGLFTEGNSLAECLAKASVEVTDQDGGEVACLDIEDVPDSVHRAAVALIKRTLEVHKQKVPNGTF